MSEKPGDHETKISCPTTFKIVKQPLNTHGTKKESLISNK
jgi:hypothetical protein